MTKEIAVFETKLPVDFTNVCWHPWINVRENDELVPGLALHKHIRERGGVTQDESPLPVFVCVRDPGSPAVDFTEFSVTKQ